MLNKINAFEREVADEKRVTDVTVRKKDIITLIRSRAGELFDGNISKDERVRIYLQIHDALKGFQKDFPSKFTSAFNQLKNAFYNITQALQTRAQDTDFNVAPAEMKPAQFKAKRAYEHPLAFAAKNNDMNYFAGNFNAIEENQLYEISEWYIPLMWAISKNHLAFALKLLELTPEHQDQLNFTSSLNNVTPLILSVAKGNGYVESNSNLSQLDIADKLLAGGADPNLTDIFGRTALHYACLHRDIKTIDLLTARGAKWDISDNQGSMPLELLYLDNETRAKLLNIVFANEIITLNDCTCDNVIAELKDVPPDVSPYSANKEKFDKIDDQICRPFYQHAKKLFLENEQYKDEDLKSQAAADWVVFEKNVRRNLEMNSSTPLSIPTITTDSLESQKSAELLKVIFELKHAKTKMIYTSDAAQKEADKKIQDIFAKALKNPIFATERGMGYPILTFIMNAISTVFATIPLWVNLAATKGSHFFFFTNQYHQPQTVTLLENAQKEFKLSTNPGASGS